MRVARHFSGGVQGRNDPAPEGRMKLACNSRELR